MFAASRAVAEGDLQAAYRIACGAPRPMAVARHILDLLQKLHPAPGDHIPEGQSPYGPPKRGVPKHIPITVGEDGQYLVPIGITGKSLEFFLDGGYPISFVVGAMRAYEELKAATDAGQCSSRVA